MAFGTVINHEMCIRPQYVALENRAVVIPEDQTVVYKDLNSMIVTNFVTDPYMVLDSMRCSESGFHMEFPFDPSYGLVITIQHSIEDNYGAEFSRGVTFIVLNEFSEQVSFGLLAVAKGNSIDIILPSTMNGTVILDTVIDNSIGDAHYYKQSFNGSSIIIEHKLGAYPQFVVYDTNGNWVPYTAIAVATGKIISMGLRLEVAFITFDKVIEGTVFMWTSIVNNYAQEQKPCL